MASYLSRLLVGRFTLPHAQDVLVFLTVGSSSVFLLPLVDPAVRRHGPAPSRLKPMLAVLALDLLLTGIDWWLVARMGWQFFGLVTAVAGGIGYLALVCVGLVLTGVGASAAGALAGGVGVTLGIAVVVAWVLAGSLWFP